MEFVDQPFRQLHWPMESGTAGHQVSEFGWPLVGQLEGGEESKSGCNTVVTDLPWSRHNYSKVLIL